MASNESDKTRHVDDLLAEINSSMDDFADRPAKSVNDRSNSGDAPLHKVAIWGDISAASLLIESGAEVDAIGEDDDTPLHRAIAGGHPEMVRLLIAFGANPELQNRYGNTPRSDAEAGSDASIIAAIRAKSRPG